MSVSLELTQASIAAIGPTGQPHIVLKDLSLRMAEKERIGVIGRSGAGKTTLLRVLAGLDRLSRGQFTRYPASARVMLVLQRPEHLFTQAQAIWEVTRFVSSHNMHDARPFLQRVGFPEDLYEVNPRRLSTGYQRLLAIACGLAVNPTWLLLDEPFAGLDHAHSLILSTLLQSLDIGLMIVTHDPQVLLGLVSRLLVLESGTLLYDGSLAVCPRDVLLTNLSAPTADALLQRLHSLESL